jgi:hypothetical protein
VASFYGKLLSSFLAGAGASLAAAALGLLFDKPRARKTVVLRMAAAAVSMIAIGAFIGFDVRVAVPNLDFLSLEDAANNLIDSHLKPDMIPTEQTSKEGFGRVVPNSQSLQGGQLIRWGGTVSFEVSDEGTIRLEHPHTNDTVDCRITSSGYCTFTVDGMGSKLLSSGRLDLVLWAKSRESNWYPQNPNPVGNDQNGTWSAEAQVGDAQNPASDGEPVDLALTVNAHGIAVIPLHRAGSPQPQGKIVDRAERVTVRVVRN